MFFAFAITALYHAAISAVTFFAYALDKHAARRGPPARRIRERTLHIFEFLGGWPGALLAQRTLRHKTVDRSFRRVFYLAATGHILAVLAIVIAWHLV